MSDWWSKALGTQAPAAPQAAPVQQVPASQPWWSTNPTPQPTPQPQQQQVVVQEDPEFIQMGQYKASLRPAALAHRSMKETDTCPACGSINYLSPSPERMKHCMECGYNPRFETMGGSMPGIASSGPVQAARGQSGGSTPVITNGVMHSPGNGYGTSG